MKTEDWLAVGLILGTIATVGLLAWALKKRGSPRREFKLRKIGQVLRNREVIKLVRDRKGRLMELEVHREVRRS